MVCPSPPAVSITISLCVSTWSKHYWRLTQPNYHWERRPQSGSNQSESSIFCSANQKVTTFSIGFSKSILGGRKKHERYFPFHYPTCTFRILYTETKPPCYPKNLHISISTMFTSLDIYIYLFAFGYICMKTCNRMYENSNFQGLLIVCEQSQKQEQKTAKSTAKCP